jgi:NAD(P)-dependent dehydrogenase (short-subunit alcohol dehydrogenase family)
LADRSDDPRVVVVTGASRGVGAATVDALLSGGWRVVAVSRSLPGRRTAEVVDVTADLADPASAQRVVAEAIDAFGRLDGLVNNAGLDLAKPLLESTVEETRRVFAVNALAPLWMIQAAVPALADRGGAIVNVTSRLAHVGVSEMAIYGASKGALRALTHGAAVELGPIGVRVNAVAPGMTETPLFREWLEGRPDPEVARAEVEARIPLGRLGSPADVASAIAYLLSDAASHITGATLPVDGGYTAA